MVWILLVALLLAFANGANDNFKGVATLVGSDTWDRRRALIWATATTLAGSLVAVFLADELLARFGGKGLVSPEIAAEPGFLGAVAAGAAATVLLATRLGMPTSTTHSLIGALIGAGAAAAGPLHLAVLGQKFVAPLMLSPLLAVVATVTLYPLLHRIRQRLGVTRNDCFCVGERSLEVVTNLPPSQVVLYSRQLEVTTGESVTCETTYSGRMLGFNAGATLDNLHVISAGTMSFARGLNDTPKIAALLLLTPALSGSSALLLCGLAIALGGWLASRRVGHTMSHRITPMNAGQGLTSNLVTTALVLTASPLGLPVSTTHVSSGALFGLGMVRGDAHWGKIAQILLTWVLTLPIATGVAAAVYLAIG